VDSGQWGDIGNGLGSEEACSQRGNQVQKRERWAMEGRAVGQRVTEMWINNLN
jgi:hypothetical protein